MNSIEIPDVADDFTDVIIWKDNNELLLKNKTNNIILRVKYISIQKYRELKNQIIQNDYAMFKFNLLSIINEADTVTQLGQYENKYVNDVQNRFEYDCPDCNEKTKYQVKGNYRGKHASCIRCGNELSILIKKCNNCKSKKIFIKNNTNYFCNDCDSRGFKQ